MKYTQLSASAKKKCRRLSGNKAKLKKGNVVKVKKATTAWNGSIWIQIKSGWLPVVVKGKYRVKAVYRKQEGRCLPTFLLIINHALCFADDLNF